MRPAATQSDPHRHQGASLHCALYRARHPEQTLLYKTIAGHFETWLELASAGQFDGQGDHHTPPAYVEQAFRKYLQCGIFAHGFARARCDDCGHDFFIAFSCKGRGVCPSCNTRRMAETAAHLTDHVFPHLPVRQWVLSVPRRLRYFLQNDPKALNAALRIFLRVIERSLRQHCPSAAGIDKIHIGACAFIHRFGSSLNTHVHFHICAIDGVFEMVPATDGAQGKDALPGVHFHPASGLDGPAIAQVQSETRRRILRAFVQRGLIDSDDAKEMVAHQHGGGFSVDAGVCIDSGDRAALERLLRYCARPPFAMERLHQRSAEQLIYHCPKPQSGGKRGDLVLTPLELIAKIAGLVPPPRTHRHRYYGVLAPNSPLRAAVTVLAMQLGEGDDAIALALPTSGEQAEPETTSRSPARYLWAMLIARIYEVFPLCCPKCSGQMRIIAFINDGAEIRKILEHIGVDPTPPKITPARGPPLWDGCDGDVDEHIADLDAWDDVDQRTPGSDTQIDQSMGW